MMLAMAETPGNANRKLVAHPLTAAVAAALLAIILYSPTVTYDLVYDDILVISDARLDEAAFGYRLWTAEWWRDGATLPVSRPLTTFTFWAQVQLHGRQPWAYHAVNVALYGVVCALVSLLAWTWLRRVWAAWLAGLVFAAHPIHVEAVANVVGRAELLAALFIMIGLLLWSRWRDHWTWPRAATIGLCVLLAGLGKEHGYLLAVMLLSVEVAQRRTINAPFLTRPWPWKPVMAIIVVAVLAGAQRSMMSQRADHGMELSLAAIDNPLVLARDADHFVTGERIVTPFKLLGQAVRLLVAPVDQSPDYSPRMLMPTDRWTDPLVLLGMVAVVAWLIAAVSAIRRRSVLAAPLLCLPIAWLVPSNTIVLIGTIFAERLLFTVSIFIALLVAGLTLATARLAWAAVICAVVVVFSVFTWQYMSVWQSNFDLVGHMAASRSARFQGYLSDLAVTGAGVYDAGPRREQLMQMADRHARLSLDLWPQQARPYGVLGELARQRGDHVTARRYFKLAQRWGGDINVGDKGLALLGDNPHYEQLVDQAAILETRLAARPDDPATMRALAGTYMLLKRYADAIALYEQLVGPDETNVDLLNAYLNALATVHDYDRGLAICTRLLALVGERWELLTEAAGLAVASGQSDEQAKRWLDQAVALSPDSPEPRAGLGRWHMAQDQMAEAAAAFQEALDRCDADDPARFEYQLDLTNALKD